MPIHPPPERWTDEANGVLDDLRRIVRALRESSRHAESTLGVTGAQLFALRALADSRPLSLNELAARTRTHQSTVSVVAGRLVDRGLVRRTRSESDGRRIELTLTSRGRALLERAPLAAQDKLIEGLDSMPRKEREHLAISLRALVRAMQLEDEAPAMFFEDEEATPSPSPKRAPRAR